MNIFLNGNQLDFILEDETNAGQILDSLETIAEENNATIVYIEINGQPVPAENIENCYSLPIDGIDELAVTTVQENDVCTSLKDLLEPISSTAEKLESVPVLLQTHHDGEVAEILKEFADNFDRMCQLATLTCLFPGRFSTLSFNGLSFQDYLKEFSPVLNEFETAMKSSDSVLTGDLAEWELKPRLEQFIASVRDFQ